MSLIRKLATEMLKSIQEKPPEPQPLAKDEIDRIVAGVRVEFVSQLEYLQLQLAFYKRRSEDYFELIEKMQTQRDEWHDIHMTESRGHQGAQVVLQEALVLARQHLGRALMLVNAYRAEKKEPPIVTLDELSKMDVNASPVGLAEQTKAHNDRVLAGAAPLLDGIAARTKIDEAFGDPPAPPEAPAETSPIQNT